MIKMNSLMSQELCDDNKTIIESEVSFKIIKIVKKLVKRIKYYNGYLIANKSTIDLKNQNIVNRIFGDKTGAEASLNETIINYELNIPSVSSSVALQFFKEYNMQLKNKYNIKFCAILSQNNNNEWIYRFHTVTDDSCLWLGEDLEKYQEAVLYDVF